MKVAPQARAALVSTNSICQGEQVANLWQKLFDDGIKINFAHRTFRWDSEASLKAHVHCVIVGFSSLYTPQEKSCIIYDGERVIQAENINPYLLNAPTVFIDNRRKPLCNVPEMLKGSSPVDGGNLIIEAEDYNDFIRREPNAAKYVHR